jgi:hypothetical protein
MDMERGKWKFEFSWVKAHAGQRGNEGANRLGKKASSSKDIEECFNRILKSTVTSELKEQCLKQWQIEWEMTTKEVTTKFFFPNIKDTLQLRINPTPNVTAIVTGHGNIKTYLHKFKIREPKMPLQQRRPNGGPYYIQLQTSRTGGGCTKSSNKKIRTMAS